MYLFFPSNRPSFTCNVIVTRGKQLVCSQKHAGFLVYFFDTTVPYDAAFTGFHFQPLNVNRLCVLATL
uniref:Uncharacterized protein n=1 Tax=Anguilla anguilla TaxID=7936 RepID=A0A0E9XBG1_ANGAN